MKGVEGKTRREAMKRWYLALICAFGVMIYVALAPFNPAVFFSIGGISVAGLVWAIVYLAKRTNFRKVGVE